MDDYDPKYWPSRKYHPDHPGGKIFQHPRDVPKGWYETPADFPKGGAESAPEKKEPEKIEVEASPAGDSDFDIPLEHPLLERLEITSTFADGFMKNAAIISEIKKRGGTVKVGMKRPDLIEKLKGLL